MTQVFKARETFTVNRLKLKPQKPKSWSHMDDLIAHKGKKIRLAILDEVNTIEGEIVDMDNFTIKIEGYFLSQTNKSAMTVFKHSISSYVLLAD